MNGQSLSRPAVSFSWRLVLRHMDSRKRHRRLQSRKRKIESFLRLVSSSEDKTCEMDSQTVEELRKKAKEQLTAKVSPKLVLCEKAYKHRKEGKPFTLDDVQSLLISCFIPYASDFAKVTQHNFTERVCVFLIGPKIELPEMDDCYFNEKFKLEIDQDVDNSNWTDPLIRVNLPKSQSRKMKDRGFETTVIFDEDENGDNRSVGKSKLILSQEELEANGFPSATDEQFKHTKTKYEEVTDSSPLYSLDCEMCKTAPDRFEVTRVTLLNEEAEVVLDTFVKPFAEIFDYVTEYSGVTKEDLDKCNTRLSDVQEQLSNILTADAILVGQSLENDLKCLQLYHPYIIDTSIIYNLSGSKDRKASLKVLTATFLGKSIQTCSIKGHCSKEDAHAALKLVHLKMQKGLVFGNCILSGRKVDDMRHFMNLGEFLEAKVVGGKSKFKMFYEFVDPNVVKFVTLINENKNLVPGIVRLSATLSIRSKCIVLIVSAANKMCWISCK